jgi:hypothetical protein
MPKPKFIQLKAFQSIQWLVDRPLSTATIDYTHTKLVRTDRYKQPSGIRKGERIVILRLDDVPAMVVKVTRVNTTVGDILKLLHRTFNAVIKHTDKGNDATFDYTAKGHRRGFYKTAVAYYHIGNYFHAKDRVKLSSDFEKNKLTPIALLGDYNFFVGLRRSRGLIHVGLET